MSFADVTNRDVNVFLQGEPLGYWSGESAIDLLVLIDPIPRDGRSMATIEVADQQLRPPTGLNRKNCVAVDSFGVGLKESGRLERLGNDWSSVVNLDHPVLKIMDYELERRYRTPHEVLYNVPVDLDISACISVSTQTGEVNWSVSDGETVLNRGSAETIGFALLALKELLKD